MLAYSLEKKNPRMPDDSTKKLLWASRIADEIEWSMDFTMKCNQKRLEVHIIQGRYMG